MEQSGASANRAIASLAVVKVAMDRYNRDYIENFVPFIATLVQKKKYSYVDLADIFPFVEDFKNHFGMNIPFHPMLTILERAKKRGLFTQEYHHLLPIWDIILKHNFSDMVLKEEVKAKKIITAFVEFCGDKLIIISESEAQDTLNDFLQNSCLDVLFSTQCSTVLPSKETTKKLRYLMNSFFNKISTSEPELFLSIVEIALGHILASTILYDEFPNFPGHLKGVGIYFDTKFIFRLLGFEGEKFKSVYKELTDGILKQGASLFIFKHTEDEIMEILQNCVDWLGNPDYDSSKSSKVCRYFNDLGKTKSDILLEMKRFEDSLKENKISIKDVPDFRDKISIDESKLETKIIDYYDLNQINHNFNEFKLQQNKGIGRDVKSISAIYRLRKGNLPRNIKDSGYIFVTLNKSLSYISMAFEIEEFPSTHIPLCFTDGFIGTVVWMQSPKKWLNISRDRLSAICAASLEPDTFFIKRIVEEAKKLKELGKINEDEYILLSRDMHIQKKLMEMAKGDPADVTDTSLEETINNVRAKVADEYKKKIEIIEKENKDLLDENNGYKINSQQQQEKFARMKSKIIKFLNYLLTPIFFAIFLFIVFFNIYFSNFLKNTTVLWEIILYIAMLTIAFASVWLGLNLKGIKRKVINKISEKITQYIGKIFY
ncbi:MAG: hypothetical protein ACYCSQ_05055 [bacterium]